MAAVPESTSSLLTTVVQHPYLSAFFLVFVCCLITRIKTGSQVRYYDASVPEGTPRPVPVVPYWIPLIGHTISFGVWFQDFLKSTAYNVPSGIYALKIGGGTHNIVVSPSLTKELLNRPSVPMGNIPIVLRFLKLVFGDQGRYTEWDKRNPTEMWDMSKILHGLQRDPFLSDGVDNIVKSIEKRTWNLVSGNSSWVDQSQWERAGKVEVVSVEPKSGNFVAEANFFGLVRDFVGDIASSTLMGHAFVENNPTLLADLWLLDSKIHSAMMGLPYWLVPGMAPMIPARARLIEAVREHHKAMMDMLDGKDPGYRYDDLSDVSNVMWERVKAFHAAGVDGLTYGVGDLTILWAMNVNANQVAFWMLFYIYSQPELLTQIRAEIAPYVSVSRSPSVGLPIQEAPRLKMDINGLFTKCVVLKGTFFETMRTEVAASGYRIVDEDFVISESKEDAARVGKPHPEKFVLKKGDIVCVPYKVHQDNPTYFDNPDKFDHKRFWVSRKDEKGEETTSVEYGSFRPWGGGKTMCKGKNFAEKEVLAFVAGILTVWDMEPVSKDGWKHPGNQVTAGTFVPKKDIRVRMTRRNF